MAIPRSGPYIWVTWLSKLLVGDASCEWATWFRAHHKDYAKMPRTHDFAAWQMDHAARLAEVRADLEFDGKTVLTERQCHFSLQGASGAMLAGRPDLVASEEQRGVIYDIKTGQPSLADHVQLMTYMYALPHVGRFRGMELSAESSTATTKLTSLPARLTTLFGATSSPSWAASHHRIRPESPRAN